MAVVIETTAGDLTVDLFVDERPRACLNFLKLCQLKYYNYNLFHTIQQGFIAQTGDPTGVGNGGSSVWDVVEGAASKRFFKSEQQPKIRHTDPGLLSMVSLEDGLIGAQFFFTLGSDLTSLDAGAHCVIGRVTEGTDVLRILNETICDDGHRPYQDVRITHTVVLDDPFDDPRGFRAPSRSPSPSAERMQGGRIGADEDVDDTDGKTDQEIAEMRQEREAKARATILEIVGDLPDADMAPPENVLFVCKLNPVTSDDDLEIIFSRFGKVKGCEVIRDRQTNDSLQYAFVEFEDAKTCESAYFKMDNVLIDDRRIHVDFSQSVAKVQWRGKGRGLIYKDGQKGDKLNFGDLKRSNGGGRGGGGAGNRQQQHQQPQNRNGGQRFNERQQPHADRRQRDRSASPSKRHTDNRPKSNYRRPEETRRDRETRAERSRSRDRQQISRGDRQRSRSRERHHQQLPQQRHRDTTDDRRRHRSKSTERRRSRSPQRHRSNRSPERRADNNDRIKTSSAASKPNRRERSPSAGSTSVDSESDSDDSSADRRKAAKKSKSKKSKKSKKKSSKKSKRYSSDDSSSDSDRHAKKKKSKKYKK